MSIKHLLNDDMVNKWQREDDGLNLATFQFKAGDLVSRTDSLGESLGIFLKQNGVWATINWTKMPEGVIFKEKQMVSDIVILSGASK